MRRVIQSLALILFTFPTLFSQPTYTALTQVTPFTGKFRPGINLGYHPNWTNTQLGVIAAGSPADGQAGVGAKTTRPGLYENVFAIYGYDLSLFDFQNYKAMGMEDLTGIIGGPPQWNLDFTNFCANQPTTIYKDLYLPIWDAGNGTPYNEANPFAAYIYKLAITYKDYITFWEVWNEPGFDFSGNGLKKPGEPNNWWDNDPNPCDYQLRAPIEHYVRMLRISWEIIKTVDPTGYVTLGDPGFPSFLDAVLRNTDNPNGGSVTPAFPLKGGAYFDCVSYHAYPHFDYTAYDPAIGLFERHSDGAAEGLIVAQNRYKAVLNTYGFNGILYPKKEWNVTEYNAPRRAITSTEWVAGAEMQRSYLLKVLMRAKVENIAQMHIYELFDHKQDAEAADEFDLMGLYQNETGVLPYNQVVQPQGKAHKTFTDLIYNTDYDAAKTAALNLPVGVKGYAFKQADNKYIYALWAETKIDKSETASKNYTFPATLGLTNLVAYAWDFGYSHTQTPLTTTTIALTGSPIFIRENNLPACNLTATINTVLCNDNGTATNPADDKFSFNLVVNGTGMNGNLYWKTTIGTQNFTGKYGIAKNLSGFNISTGNLTFIVRDTANQTCTTTVAVTAPSPCSNQSVTQYCASKSDFPWHEWISNVKTGSINNPSEKSYYSDFTNVSATLSAGVTHPITINMGFSYLTFNEYVRIWIDYDKDNVFETSEVAYEGIFNAPTLGVTSGVLMGNLTIPANATLGTTRMRICMKRGSYASPCELIPFGEVEDYGVNIGTGGTTCNISATISDKICNNNGTPTIGGDDTYTFTALVNGSNTGNGWTATMGQTVVSGLYGTPRTIGPLPIISGTTTFEVRDLATTTCLTTQSIPAPQPCSNGGGTGTYCASSSDFPWQDWIAQISLSDLNYTSSKNQYSDFLGLTATVAVGATLPIQLTSGFSWQGYDEYWGVWIDFNKNGTFELSERVVNQLKNAPAFPTPLWSLSSNITIPAGVSAGVTRMRVVMRRGTIEPDPCGVYTNGETEDYSINITSGTQTCQLFAQISNLSCQNNGTGGNPADDTYSFSLTVTGAGVGTSGWKAKINNVNVTGTYGVAKSLSGYAISAGNLAFVVRDAMDTTCTQSVAVVAPPTCSVQTGPCASTSSFPWHDWIAKVQLSNINNPTGKSQYSDFTAQTINLNKGGTYPLSLSTGNSYFSYAEYWRIWIDYNKNGAFESTELAFEQNFPTGPASYLVNYTGSITIPLTAASGLTKMRVSMKRDAYADACETLPFGEVEDYGVNISVGLTAGDGRSIENPILNLNPKDDNLLLFPNPAGEMVQVLVEDYLGKPLNVVFYNHLGLKVKSIKFDKIEQKIIEIPLDKVANGQYFVQFSSPEKRVVSKKLVVGRMY
jgi:hypothetical protein